jgi:hypothetical protein
LLTGSALELLGGGVVEVLGGLLVVVVTVGGPAVAVGAMGVMTGAGLGLPVEVPAVVVRVGFPVVVVGLLGARIGGAVGVLGGRAPGGVVAGLVGGA